MLKCSYEVLVVERVDWGGRLVISGLFAISAAREKELRDSGGCSIVGSIGCLKDGIVGGWRSIMRRL